MWAHISACAQSGEWSEHFWKLWPLGSASSTAEQAAPKPANQTRNKRSLAGCLGFEQRRDFGWLDMTGAAATDDDYDDVITAESNQAVSSNKSAQAKTLTIFQLARIETLGTTLQHLDWRLCRKSHSNQRGLMTLCWGRGRGRSRGGPPLTFPRARVYCWSRVPPPRSPTAPPPGPLCPAPTPARTAGRLAAWSAGWAGQGGRGGPTHPARVAVHSVSSSWSAASAPPPLPSDD